MKNAVRAVQGILILAIMASATGCIVAEPREAHYDRDHHRYYHEHAWHECGERNDFCR